MIKKISLALFLGLMACSDDSSGTSANIDSGDQINIPISGVSSSLAVSGSSSSADAVSSSQDPVSSSSVKPASSVSSVMSSSAESISSASLAKSSSSAMKDSPTSSAAAKSSSSTSKDSPISSAVVESSSSVEKNTPVSSASDNAFFNEGWREGCLAKINEYRATENLKPLALASEEKQACADKQSADDLASNKAHGHMGACGEFAQNSGPNFSLSWRKSASAVTDAFLKMMWEDEKALVESGERDPEKSEDYSYIGHYINMRSKSYTKVACGIALDADGKKGWLNIDFF